MQAILRATVDTESLQSPILPLARRLRALSSTLSRSSLEPLYRSLILPEDVLARKWRVTVPELVNTCITGETPAAPKEGDEERVGLGGEEKERLEEAVRKRQRAIDKGRPPPVVTTARKEDREGEDDEEQEKVSFVKPPPVRDWVDGWAARESVSCPLFRPHALADIASAERNSKASSSSNSSSSVHPLTPTPPPPRPSSPPLTPRSRPPRPPNPNVPP